MHIAGHWSLLDYASVKDLNFGVAVLPKFKEPVTVVLGSPTVIFADTKNREAAIRFYKFHNNPEAVNLFARGLWMPLQKTYYTEPAKMKLWLDNPGAPGGDAADLHRLHRQLFPAAPVVLSAQLRRGAG